MKVEVDTLTAIPCFKCIFWDPKPCNPDECQKLTEWLLKQLESQEQTGEILVDAKSICTEVKKEK